MGRIFAKVSTALFAALLALSVAVVCRADAEKPVTRAEFAGILMSAIDGKPVPEKAAKADAPAFSDVARGSAYYDAVYGAAGKGYISGYPDGTFGPDKPVSFEDMVTITSNMLQMSRDIDADAYLSDFADGDSVSSYARAYVAENIARGYVDITGEKIGPKRTVGESEAEAYVSRVMSENLAFGLDIPDGTAQLIVVASPDYGVNTARAHLYEMDGSGVWQDVDNFDCFIGKSGFSDDKLLEGRLNTPVGLYTISLTFGTGDNPGTNMPYRKIVPGDVWVDDPKSALYNTWQEKTGNNGQWNSAENMNVSAYSLGFVIDYNTARTPYAGSAFFFHVYGKRTAGCVGAAKEDVLATLKWLDKDMKPMILLCPETELGRFGG